MRSLLKLLLVLSLVISFFIPLQGHAKEKPVYNFTVTTAYLELRSGPARGFPVVHSLRRGDTFIILKQKTGWFQISQELADKSKSGWITSKQIATTRSEGKAVEVEVLSSEQFEKKTWAFGFATGEVHGGNNNGTPLLSIFGGYQFTPNLALEVSATQVLGKYSESVTGQLNITHEIGPDWIISPLISLGIGTIETDPKATLGNTKAVENDALNWGIGAKAYIRNRFFIRMDYNNYILLSQNDDLSTVESWKLGVGVFF